MLPLLAVVEDDDSLRELLADLFSQEGYRTLLLAEGARAYHTIRHMQPDVVLLDLWLEHRDAGWALLEQLQADLATRPLPIIVCSASTESLPVQAAQLAGRGCFIVAKPFDLEELLAVVHQALCQRRPAHVNGETGPATGAADEGPDQG